MTSPKNHYELLGISRNADTTTLRTAFRVLSKTLHPDTTSLPVKEAAQKFQQVCEAYELLSDPLLRAAYDKSLRKKALVESLDRRISLNSQEKVFTQIKQSDVRRPFSGGELFSLFLLGLALLLSLVVGIGFAYMQGREFQVRPSWLVAELKIEKPSFKRNTNVSNPFRTNTSQSAFPKGFGSLAE